MKLACLTKIAMVGTLGVFSLLGLAASRVAGRAVRIVGSVTLYDANKSSKPLAVGDAFSEGDVIETGPDGRAKLAMSEGGNEVVVGSATRLVIDRVGSQARGGSSGTSLSLEQGQVRSVVRKKYSGLDGDVFEVKTPNAVAGVRGTVFLVGFEPKQFRSLLATEEGAVIWRSQGKELLVAKGRFSTVIGKDILPATPLESNPSVNSELQDFKQQDLSSESKGQDSESLSTQTTGFDAEGNEVVLEESPDSSGSARAPASVGTEDLSSQSPERASMGAEEQKLALSKVPVSSAQPTAAVVDAQSPMDILKAQKTLLDQAGYVKQNSDMLNPAVVSVPIK